MVRELVKREHYIDRLSKNGNTALMLAARSGSLKTLNTLLRYSENLEHRNLAGNSALMLAAELGHLVIVKRLLEVNANAHHLNRRRESAYDLAKQGNHDEVAEYIEANKGSGGLLDFMR
jgi:ankyrin repeat protein